MDLLCAQANARCKTHLDAAGDSAAVRATTASNAKVFRKCRSENGIVLSILVIRVWFSERAQKEKKV